MKTYNIKNRKIKGLLLILLTLSLTACPGEDKSSPIGTGGGRDGRTSGNGRNQTRPGTVNSQASSGYVGVIWAGEGVTQNDFQYRVDNFMSVSGDPVEMIGVVSGDTNGATGLRFLALNKVELANGTPVLTNSVGPLRAGTGDMQILVWDEKAQESGLAYQPSFKMTSGQINNGTVTMALSDEYGHLNVHGWIKDGYFYGFIDFDNDRYWDDPSEGAANRLGAFYIPTCEYFKCQ